MNISDTNFQTLYGNDGNLNTALPTAGAIQSSYAAGPTTLSGETTLTSITFTPLAVPYLIVGKARLVWPTGSSTNSIDVTLSLYEDATLLDSSNARLNVSSMTVYTASLPVSASRTPTAASHTYAIKATPVAPTTNWTAENTSLVLIEGI